jgi:hypothetical protein
MLSLPVEIILLILEESLKNEDKNKKINYILISKSFLRLLHKPFTLDRWNHLWKNQNIKLIKIVLFYLIEKINFSSCFFIHLKKEILYDNIIINFLDHILFVDFDILYKTLITNFIQLEYISLSLKISFVFVKELIINSKNIKYINTTPIFYRKLKSIFKNHNINIFTKIN